MKCLPWAGKSRGMCDQPQSPPYKKKGSSVGWNAIGMSGHMKVVCHHALGLSTNKKRETAFFF